MARNVFRHPFAVVVTVTVVGGVAQAATAEPARTRRPVRYVVAGTLRAVDGATVTLAPARAAPVTVTVAGDAAVIRNDAAATLADLVPGDHVAATGTQAGTAVTVTALVATAPGFLGPPA